MVVYNSYLRHDHDAKKYYLGLPGNHGPIGVSGLTGIDGEPGIDGIKGFKGSRGEPGSVLLMGEWGEQGMEFIHNNNYYVSLE